MCQSGLFYQELARRYYGEWNEVPFYANKLCDEYGLDTDAFQPMIIWLLRCHRAGILTDENTGIPLSKIGSLEFIETLVKKISFRHGFGDMLAQGTVRAANLVGSGADKLMTDSILKAGHSSLYDGRFFITTGLLYAMEPRQPIQQLHEISRPLRRRRLNAPTFSRR